MQALVTYNNTTTESLTFNHTEASGTGAQQTTASGALVGDTTYNRTGEYTPLGRNINDAGPYTTLNTSEPPEFGSGVNLFPSAEGYRPGRNEYTLEGIPVPESAFMNVINSGLVGGAFGLLAYSVRMSAREVLGYTVDIKDGDMFLRREGIFINKGDALKFAAQRGISTIDRWIIPNNWQVIASLATQIQRDEPKFPKGNTSSQKQKEAVGNAYRDALDRLQNQECAKLFTDFYDEFGEFVNWLDEHQDLYSDFYTFLADLKSDFNSLARNPSDVLRDITFSILRLSNRRIGAAQPGEGSIWINSNGPFFNRTLIINGNIETFNFRNTRRLNQTQFAALLILHELGHAYGRVGSNLYLFGSDEGNDELNEQYTQRVIDACFPELNND